MVGLQNNIKNMLIQISNENNTKQTESETLANVSRYINLIECTKNKLVEDKLNFMNEKRKNYYDKISLQRDYVHGNERYGHLVSSNAEVYFEGNKLRYNMDMSYKERAYNIGDMLSENYNMLIGYYSKLNSVFESDVITTNTIRNVLVDLWIYIEELINDPMVYNKDGYEISYLNKFIDYVGILGFKVDILKNDIRKEGENYE